MMNLPVFPAHDLILQPLLLRAEDCYVYGLEGNAELLKQCSRILSPTRNKYKMDLYQDVIKRIRTIMECTGMGERLYCDCNGTKPV
ncbi:hypothetical protein GCM10020331_055200 [Ectobacillus funiculus]